MRKHELIALAALLGLLRSGYAVEPSGVVEGGLRLVVTSDKSAYAAGEPIRIRLAWTNLGAGEVLIPTWRGAQMGETAARYGGGEPMLLALEIYRDGKDRIPHSGVIGCGPDDGVRIPPGETRDSEFQIDDTFDVAQSGRYVVRVAFAGFNDDRARPHGWKGLLRHPDVEFTVRAKGEQ